MIVRKRKSKRVTKTKSAFEPNTTLKIDAVEDNFEIDTNSKFSKLKSKKINIISFIVYVREFDKFDDNGNPKCRNHGCNESVCKPFKKYCSKKCSLQFTRWYNSNFYWRNIRNRVLKRDNYTCQICRITLHRRKRYNRAQKNWLECDHIIPKSYYYHLGYQFDTLDNKVKTILEFVHNEDNLRTVCYKCHKKVSATVLGNRSKLINLNNDVDYLL